MPLQSADQPCRTAACPAQTPGQTPDRATTLAPDQATDPVPELLLVRDLTFHYPGFSTAGNSLAAEHEMSQGKLSDISFSIAAGEKVALVGPNGSGKSTLLLLLCGCLAPHQGKVFIRGQDCTANPELARQSLAKLFQDPDNQLFMPSVREELLFSLLHSNAAGRATTGLAAGLGTGLATERATGLVTDRARLVREAMESFNLTHLAERAPHHLSVGEKKRVALASLLLTRPKLLLLDEPTAGLDPRSRRNLNRKLRELETGLLMATHDLDMALEVAERVIVLHHGRIAGESALPGLLAQADFLERHGLELPLSLQRSK